MTVLIEDSPRNLNPWIIDAVGDGLADGAVISPFASPWAKHGGAGMKPSARDRSERLRSSGVNVWFDPTTHALQMSDVGDFRYYTEYSLWNGPRGDLSTPAHREEHVRRVFQVQGNLVARHLGPTVLLHHGLSRDSTLALDLSKEAVTRDSNCWLSIAGTSSFWASGSALDAHIGALAQLEPAGWFLTVVREVSVLPVEPSIEEIHGLCRTVRALSEDASVHISHGDLAALPAVAAGAKTVGSGWDKRQRVCSYADYAARPTGGAGGGWYERPTFTGLMGSLTKREAAVLYSADPARANRLGYRSAPGPKEAFQHHMRALNALISPIKGESDPMLRYQTLLDAYGAAEREWPEVVRITGCTLGADKWIVPFRAGLERYGRTEGW